MENNAVLIDSMQTVISKLMSIWTHIQLHSRTHLFLHVLYIFMETCFCTWMPLFGVGQLYITNSSLLHRVNDMPKSSLVDITAHAMRLLYLHEQCDVRPSTHKIVAPLLWKYAIQHTSFSWDGGGLHSLTGFSCWGDGERGDSEAWTYYHMMHHPVQQASLSLRCNHSHVWSNTFYTDERCNHLHYNHLLSYYYSHYLQP